MELDRYLELTRWDRFKLHEKLSDFIAKANEDIADGATAAEAAPRTVRRTGAF